MGEIDHAKGAEDQRQPKRDHGRAFVEAVEHLQLDCVHGPHLWWKRLQAAGRLQDKKGAQDQAARHLVMDHAPGLHLPRSPPANIG